MNKTEKIGKNKNKKSLAKKNDCNKDRLNEIKIEETNEKGERR